VGHERRGGLRDKNMNGLQNTFKDFFFTYLCLVCKSFSIFDSSPRKRQVISGGNSMTTLRVLVSCRLLLFDTIRVSRMRIFTYFMTFDGNICSRSHAGLYTVEEPLYVGIVALVSIWFMSPFPSDFSLA
jgi:hypothetical protein